MALSEFTFTSRARPIVELGIGDSRVPTGQGRWDTSRWDAASALWAGTEPTWLDVSCFIVSADTALGRDRVTDRFRIGRATVVVDNSTGWADPKLAEPPALLTMRPGRAIRIGIDHATLGRRWLWRGFVDELDPLYDPVEPDTAAFSCIDALGEVNRAVLAGNAAPIGDGDTPTTRVTRVLDAAMWPLGKRRFDATSTPLIADRLTGQVADLVGRATDSGGGAIYGDTDGNIRLRNRDWQAYAPTIPPDATIGNIDPGDVCPTRYVRPFRRRDIATRVVLNRQGASTPPRIYDDPDGRRYYGIEPFEQSDLWTRNDADLDVLGARLLQTRGAATAPRLRSASFDATTADNVIDLLTTVDPYLPSRYLCRLRLPRGVVFSAQHFATGVSHHLERETWTADVDLDVAAPYAAVGARWDQAYWDKTVWAGATALLNEARALRDQLIGAAR